MSPDPKRVPPPDSSSADTGDGELLPYGQRRGDRARRASRTPHPSGPPPLIPGYEVGEVVGRGAMGTVYRARQLIVDRDVALKVLHPHLSREERLVLRLRREARTTARLAHPHVVSAIDMGETEGLWWYAMEFVDGPSLALRLRQEGRLKEREALRLFIPLVEALEHLDQNGVVHRDIKPANILIDRTGGARLADLGLAFADDDPRMTGHGGTLGTPHYISPEQAVDSSAADVRSDIWSLGATLFHAVCGRTPFTGESAAEILSAVLYQRVPDPRSLEPRLSRGLALVLRKCLTHEPEGRYQTPRELLLDLERVRERRAPRVRRGTLDPVERRFGTPMWILAGTLVLALVVGGTWALTKLSQENRVDEPVAAAPVVERNNALELLAMRASRANPDDFVQQRRDLDALRKDLDEVYLPRWNEIDLELSERLRRIVRSTQQETLNEMEGALAERDFAAAHRAFRTDFDKRILERTGYRTSELDAAGIAVDAWLAKSAGRLDAALDAAQKELKAALEVWMRRTLDEVERRIERSDWRGALALLLPDARSILAAAGLDEVRMPASYLDEAIEYEARMPLWLERERLKPRWSRVDSELTTRIKKRADTLRDELEERRPRTHAADGLTAWFELELEERGLTRDEMPIGVDGFTVACLDVLEKKRGELAQREDELLEADARYDERETSQFCAPLWRARRYEDVGALWTELLARLHELEDRTTAEWLFDLEHRAQRREYEAQLLSKFLARASAHVRDLNGTVVDEISIGAIRYTDRRITSGFDPLHEGGFYVEGVEGRVDLRALPAVQLVRFAELDDVAAATPEERLMLAAFHTREHEYQRALDVLRPALFDDGLLAELEAELESRAHTSIEQRSETVERRSAEAREHLELVFDVDRQGRAPTNIAARIELLLDEYADVPEVRDRANELRALADELDSQPKQTFWDTIESVFGPTEYEKSGFRRVRMEFGFEALRVGAWQRGDWQPDGAGWSRDRPTPDWETFAAQGPARLTLPAPLDLENFDVTIELEQSVGPAKLLVVSIAGFHVALSGPALKGGGQTGRVLVGSGSFDDFLGAVAAGEGEEDGNLLRSGRRHTLHLQGIRGVGRLVVELDGREIASARVKKPANDANLSLSIRSWERVWIRHVELETGYTVH